MKREYVVLINQKGHSVINLNNVFLANKGVLFVLPLKILFNINANHANIIIIYLIILVL